jgi:hypothetical protein
LCVNSVENVLCEENLGVESGSALSLLFCPSVELWWLAYLVLEFLVFCQQSCKFFFLVSELMLSVKEIRFQSVLFKFENVTDLLHLFVFYSLQLYSNLLSDLNSLSSWNVSVLQNVYIADPFWFEVSLELSTPLLQEIIAWFQHFICLLLTFEILSHKIDLKVSLSLSIADLSFEFMNWSSELLNLSFVVGKEIVQWILLCSVFGLQISHFLSVFVS